ncbi:MAG: hypothetical protein GX228_01220 [Firmicutes bacterium]|nr:hypothetical protein [Bacillota bacterium]NLL87535.1 hypothetical protein [Bacillota bacterium]HKM17435.1 hypothetical protein [Limnochordia bacterium]
MKACRMPIGFAVVILVFTTVVKAESESDVRFCDPHHLFHVVIPSGWIFQAGESSSHLLVFYGPEHDQLIYIEYFPEIAFSDPMDFAANVLEHYSADYGLPKFELVRELEPIDLGGVKAALAEYDYLGRIERTECRVFVIIDQIGLTITLSEAKPHYAVSKAQFDLILADWGWEVSP